MIVFYISAEIYIFEKSICNNGTFSLRIQLQLRIL